MSESLAAGPVRGSTAPSRTHARKSATTFRGSFPGGGILGPLCSRALISRLLSGRPGITVGPESPPVRRPSRKSSRRFPLAGFEVAEWHLKQCFCKTGRIRSSKKRTAAESWRPGGSADDDRGEASAATQTARAMQRF